ncbi:hypothetical protein [Marinobacter nauticus]|uniref:hypothetical protein n=1 Tax=Marinobacter nauticus TaxID=2743 RepID=UPI0005A2C86D|nr:hypothetical protein [Marinobacter nauticus]TPW22188.1 hypothetical protein FH712_18125 [Marinobacter nauticus]
MSYQAHIGRVTKIAFGLMGYGALFWILFLTAKFYWNDFTSEELPQNHQQYNRQYLGSALKNATDIQGYVGMQLEGASVDSFDLSSPFASSYHYSILVNQAKKAGFSFSPTYPEGSVGYVLSLANHMLTGEDSPKLFDYDELALKRLRIHRESALLN